MALFNRVKFIQIPGDKPVVSRVVFMVLDCFLV